MLVGSEAYRAALRSYNNVKMVSKMNTESAASVYDDLSAPRTKSSVGDPTRAGIRPTPGCGAPH